MPRTLVHVALDDNPEQPLLQAVADPLDKFQDIETNRLINACGLIPGWVLNPASWGETLIETLSRNYPFGLHPMPPGSKIENKVHKYPEDPDLYPLLEITRRDETLLQYQYGIVAVLDPDGQTVLITRMD